MSEGKGSSDTPKSTTTIFSRNSTGLVREIAPHQAFIYNFMAIGLCTFTWVTLFSIAYSQPLIGANVGLAIVIMAIAAIPFYLCTSMLASALPRSGETTSGRAGYYI